MDLVGREREILELRDALADAMRGQGRFVLLCGEPGIGKTRLSEEVAAEGLDRQAAVLWGRCWESGGAPAYWPWTQILRSHMRGPALAALQRDYGVQLNEVGHLVPELRAAISGGSSEATRPLRGSETASDLEDARFRMMDAVASLLRAAAFTQPLVLVLEDIHAADLASLRLLLFLTHDLRNAPLLVVATYRGAEVRANRALDELVSEIERNGRVILLSGLDPEATASMLRRLVGTVTPTVAKQVHEVTEGIPLFVTEVARVLLEERRAGASDPDTLANVLPQRLRNAAWRSLRPLPASTRSILTAAAVGGREIDPWILERVVATDQPGTKAGEVRRALELAREAGVVSSIVGTQRYLFFHALVRDALYAEVPLDSRERLHRRFAEVLESDRNLLPSGAVTEIAHHLYAAGSAAPTLAKATQYATLAGEHAMQCFAFEEARFHFQRAVECLLRCDEDDVNEATRRRAEILLRLALAQRSAGNVNEARGTLVEVAQLARRIDAAELLARAATEVDEGVVGTFDPQQVALLEEALAGLPATPTALRARTLATLAMALYQGGQLERREALSREAVEIARSVGDVDTLALVLHRRAISLLVPEYAEQRLAAADEHLRLTQEARDQTLSRYAYSWQMLGALERGDMHSFEAAAASFHRITETYREPNYRFTGSMWAPMRALLEGRISEAEMLANETLNLGMAAHRENALAAYSAHMLFVRWEQGCLDQLVAQLEPALLGDPNPRHEFRAILAFAYSEIGRHAEARAQYDYLVADSCRAVTHDLNWLAIMVMLATVCRNLGDHKHAPLLYETLAPFSERAAIVSMAVACWGSVARYLGILGTMMGKWEDAQRHFESAMAMHERMGAAPLLARTRLDYAQMLIDRGAGDAADSALASELLAQALETSRALSLTGITRKAEQLLSMAGAVPIGGVGRPERAPTVAEPTEPSYERIPPSAFRKEGDVWSLSYAGQTRRVRDTKGVACIAHLLSQPGCEIHALDLFNAIEGGVALADPREIGDAGALLDDSAKRSYRARLRELYAELREAEDFNDSGRIETVRSEVAFLEQEIARAVGLGGRDRRAGSHGERARLNVTRAIGTAMKKIAAAHPELAEHLRRTIRTGNFCEYSPDPRVPIVWEVGSSRQDS